MKRALATTVAVLVSLLLVLTIGWPPAATQGPTPTSQPTLTPGTPIPTRPPDLERRLYELEVGQALALKSLESANNANRFFMTLLGAIVGLQIAIQGAFSYGQWRREGEREARQVRREDQWDLTQCAGVNQVSSIMEVVQRTLESRLASEEAARSRIEEAYEILSKVQDELDSLKSFRGSFQEIIRRERAALEETASRLAQVPRHSFRSMVRELQNFAQKFDRFGEEFAILEEEPHVEFTARVAYSRGIAAHYTDQPQTAVQWLTEVTGAGQPERGEPRTHYEQRVAAAYYYLGLINLNFDECAAAVSFLEEANRPEYGGADSLTKLVNAEAHVMMREFDRATQLVKEIEDEYKEREDQKGLSPNDQRRMQSRTALIKANIEILQHKADWQTRVQELLESVRKEDPRYYYATITLAQVCSQQGHQADAQRLFREAYETIGHSGDLMTVTETRSRILLLMAAALCYKHGPGDENGAEDHLAEVESLIGDLPRLDTKLCTAFSILSKRNESSEEISRHIKAIRRDEVLLVED